MKITKFHRFDCQEATGVAVVIDVIRAFTTAAYAFAAGADKIMVVKEIEDAFAYHRHYPHYLLMGELEGKPIDGFHFGNSPRQFDDSDIAGCTLVQRTSSGTQGVAAVVNADTILPASFVVAQATLNRILALQPRQVSFIITGRHDGSEDMALADYLEACLLGHNPDPRHYLQRVKEAPSAKRTLTDPHHYCCSRDDLEAALRIDQYPFALEVASTPDGMAMLPVDALGKRWNP